MTAGDSVAKLGLTIHTHFGYAPKLKEYWEEIWGLLKKIWGYEVPMTGLVLYLNLTVEKS